MFFMTRQMLRRSRSCPSGDSIFSDVQALGRNALHATSENLSIAADAENGDCESDVVEVVGRRQSTVGLKPEVNLPSVSGDNSEAATTLNIQLLCELTTTSKFDKRTTVPFGIDFIQGTENILIADCANRKVKIFDLEENLKVECVVPRGYGTLREPVSAFLNKQGHILVADRSGGNIKVFTSEGRLLTSFGRDLGRPRDICGSLDLDTIYVVDEKRQDVFLYTTYSAKCRKKLGEQSKKNINFSTSLSISSTVNHLVVCDGGNKKLLVFDKRGQFLREADLPPHPEKVASGTAERDIGPSNSSTSAHPSSVSSTSWAMCHVWGDTVLCTASNDHSVLIDTMKNGCSLVHLHTQSPFLSITSNRAGLMASSTQHSDIVRIFRYKP